MRLFAKVCVSWKISLTKNAFQDLEMWLQSSNGLAVSFHKPQAVSFENLMAECLSSAGKADHFTTDGASTAHWKVSLLTDSQLDCLGLKDASSERRAPIAGFLRLGLLCKYSILTHRLPLNPS